MKRMILILTGITATCFMLSSCEDFLDIPAPSSKIPSELVFQDDVMATSALTGIYMGLYSTTGFAGGNNQSVVALAGLSADELENNVNNPLYLEFQNNAIDPTSSYVKSLWSSMYKSIYDANSALEGLKASTTLTASVKTQLTGEALFVRAFCYFYLVNFFGNVPLAISSDYKVNGALKRTPVAEVYNQIKSDLSAAEDLLAESYAGNDRVRPNKSTATALLARVYLYTGDWARAEDKATKIIGSTGLYSLSDLNHVFLSTSREAIWQLRPHDAPTYTNEGYGFSILLGPSNNVLRDEVVSAFESGDGRMTNWTTNVTARGVTVYLPYKYKRYSTGGLTDEYSMVLRLAEVYLIRAEARLYQDKLTTSIGDLDQIRKRAGLPLIQDTRPDISKEELLQAIEQERRMEFLAEWGHRWLDLKRWNRAGAVLADIKLAWTEDDLLYPIPSGELSKNLNLQPQNHGY